MQWLTAYLQTIGFAGYWIVFLLSAGEDFIVTGWFVPGSVAVVIAGGLAANEVYDPWLMFVFSVGGAFVGSSISYEFGRRGKTFIERHPYLKKKMEQTRSLFQNHRWKAVFIGRLIGGMRPTVGFFAGVMHMERWLFYTANVLGAALWVAIYLTLGYAFGSAWKLILVWLGRAGLVLLVVVVVTVLIVLLRRWWMNEGRLSPLASAHRSDSDPNSSS